MRPGTTVNGNATRDTTGARTVWEASACLMSLAESGRTSQKVSVRSNGVCDTAQKFA